MALTTDTAPRIHLSPAQVLQDPHRMKRLKAALADGIFRYADDEAVGRIVDTSFQICGGSSDTLSQVLQTKFFAGHTPLYWTITNRHSMPGTPPLLTQLLAICNPLSKETQDDIIDAFYREYDSELYCAIQDHLTDTQVHTAYSTSEFFNRDEDHPVLTASSSDAYDMKATVNFKIPRFFDRLLIDEEFTFEFLLVERLWRLKMKLRDAIPGVSSQSNWCFEISELRCKDGYNPGRSWSIKVGIEGAGGKTLTWHGFDSNCRWYGQSVEYTDIVGETPKALVVPEGELARLLCNPYTSNESGQLSATLNMTCRS